ncbi:MAG: 50S ribosomal protein L24 [Labilithrix sp.]|nr:50S ribosomal protein L24 [Labilithrix sp.]MCW5817608.1 50S ribosomal protein L24 [Labilithrix sp.]
MSTQRLQKGDQVIVIAGKDKGKKGKVMRLFIETDRVVVEGVNLVKRHMKPNPRMQQGGILEREQPLAASNVMLVDPKTGKGTRVRIKTDDKGKKVRVAVKSGEEIPSPRKAASAEKAS